MKNIFSNEGISAQEINECYLCGSQGRIVYKNLKDKLFNVKGTWDIMECEECNLSWINPRPIPEDMNKLYLEYYTHNSRQLARILIDIDEGMIHKLLKYKDESRKSLFFKAGKLLSHLGIFREWAEGRIMWLNSSEKGRLLDIGCGSGKFLCRMKGYGWNVIGIDPDPHAVKLAKERFGVETYRGALEEMSFRPDTFDVITMNHVLEHLPDPLATLKKCKELLKHNGKLIIATPNIDSLGRKIFKSCWKGWDIPRHLFLFSPILLKNFLTKTDFKIIELKTVTRSSISIWVESFLIKKNISFNRKIKRSVRFWVTGLVFWIMEYLANKLFPYGEEIIAIAEKQ